MRISWWNGKHQGKLENNSSTEATIYTYHLGNWKSIRYQDAGTEYKRKDQFLDTADN
jgi:hypothetical protein